MSTDAHSPVTGRWGVEGIWDITFGSLIVALLGILVLVLATRRWHRAAGAAGILMVIPGFFAVQWLGGVQVEDGGESIDCLMKGSIDYDTRCGEAYLERYVLTATPIALELLGFVFVLVLVVRSRRQAQSAARDF